ncbi:LamG domain-containing protein [Lysinibacillus fusiformis]|uniref:LamG domain-containing protein n=1 Tax=Lysinibacillus fusiformis TaxID=28031 RepID=UPI00148C8F20|nr:LamG domain-containing protein [Lysinibacillus fusiformis]NOG27209.1 LamG domain-containing protein [Lysinibacillus fusiformis]
MAGQGRPPHLKGEDESNITILSSYHEGADPKSILLNGVVGDGLSNATLLNINGYIEFSCSEEITLWACGGYYSDSGGNSGTGKVFIQKKQNDGTFLNLKESNCPLNATVWLDMTGKISAGTYRIATSTSRYPVFSEFFAQRMIVNKSFILHDGEYKKIEQKKEYSVFYNGTSSRMRTTKVHKYNVVTLETWVKPYTFSSTNQDIMSNVENGGHSIGLLNGKSYARFYINGAYRVCYGDMLPLNLWSHLATTFDGNIIKLYVNGTKVSELAYSGTVGSTSAIFSLGANPAATSGYIEYFNGELKDSRIWSVARTELQISKNMFQLSDIDSVSDNLVAWYLQNENFGTVCKDNSKYASDGTYYNTTFVIEYFPKNILTVSNSLPNSTKFSEDGMDSLSPLFDSELTKLDPVSMTDKSEILNVGETGKIFTKTIDLKKYLDTRSIGIEVR